MKPIITGRRGPGKNSVLLRNKHDGEKQYDEIPVRPKRNPPPPDYSVLHWQWAMAELRCPFCGEKEIFARSTSPRSIQPLQKFPMFSCQSRRCDSGWFIQANSRQDALDKLTSANRSMKPDYRGMSMIPYHVANELIPRQGEPREVDTESYMFIDPNPESTITTRGFTNSSDVGACLDRKIGDGRYSRLMFTVSLSGARALRDLLSIHLQKHGL